MWILYQVEISYDSSRNIQRMLVVKSIVISHAGCFTMQVSTAQILRADCLARSGLNQRRTFEFNEDDLKFSKSLVWLWVELDLPPKKMVPCLRMITFSSDMAGTYAPPAVQLPITTEIYSKINQF